MASCGHTYHPWCLLVHIISSRKCKVVGCEKMFEANWCSSFGLCKPMAKMFGSFMNLEAITKLGGSLQLTPSCDIFQIGMSSFYFFVE